jgi:hypothetical protein
MSRVPKQLVGLWMLAVMAHWAWSNGILVYGLATYALQRLLGV